MSELEDKINAVLNDPEQMDKIANLAKSLMGGGTPNNDAREENPDSGNMLGSLGIDADMLQKISRIMGQGGGEKPQERALLEAMKPYLSEKRRDKMDRAMKLAKLARIAKLAMGEMGGDGGD